jgi:hypothetical protein
VRDGDRQIEEEGLIDRAADKIKRFGQKEVLRIGSSGTSIAASFLNKDVG